MVFVGDSIVRIYKALNKGDDVVVCFPGAKIEAITESGKRGWVLAREDLFLFT